MWNNKSLPRQMFWNTKSLENQPRIIMEIISYNTYIKEDIFIKLFWHFM